MNKHNKSRSSFSAKSVTCWLQQALPSDLKYLAFSLPRSKIRRRNFPPHLYPAGAHLRLLHDRCRVRHRTHDTKSGRRFPVVRQMAFRRGWINAIIPILIVPYYSVIGGWVIKYLIELREGQQYPARRGRLFSFISNGVSTELCFAVFLPYYGRHHLRRWRKRH